MYVQKVVEGKSSYELSWKVQVMMKQDKKKVRFPKFSGGGVPEQHGCLIGGNHLIRSRL